MRSGWTERLNLAGASRPLPSAAPVVATEAVEAAAVSGRPSPTPIASAQSLDPIATGRRRKKSQ